MAAANEDFEIREKVSREAAKAIQDACTKLRYECVFVGEIACFGYGGSRPPAIIEALLIPRNQSESKTNIGALKRLIAIQPSDVDGRLNITPFNVSPTVLSFEHNQYADQWKSMVIEITIASETDALDVQPLETIGGLQYACPEHILARRLKLWIQAHTITPRAQSMKVRVMHRNREIDPLLKHLSKMRKKITNWNEFDAQHILQYCAAYQPSAAKLWLQVGLNPKLVMPSESTESKPVASGSSTPIPPPATPTPSVAPPPYQADAITPTPSRMSSSSIASTPKLQPEPVAPPPSNTPQTVQQQPATLPPPSNIHQTAPPSNTHQAPSTSQTQAEIFFSTPRIKMIHLAAQRTTELLRAMFLPSAIFGSLACFMYGNRRLPNDVNILVIPPSDCDLKVEEVKMLIVVKDPEHFFVVPAKDPNLDYNNILYYRLAQTGASETPLMSCKVDLVFPGTFELPRVPTSMIKWSEGLPLIPFSVLLLQKLQSWDHHGQAKGKRKAMKRKTDVEDLRGMFDLDMMEDLRNSSPWTDDTLFTWTFLQDSLSRAQEFCDAHPDTLECWRHVGFML